MSEITLKDVKSSNIKGIGYDEATKTLAIEFIGGGVYHYENVPKADFEKMNKSDSIGSYFFKNIRNSFKYKLQPAKKKDQR